MNRITEIFTEKSIKIITFVAIVLAPVIFSTKAFYFFTTSKYMVISAGAALLVPLVGIILLRYKFGFSKNTKLALVIIASFVTWLLVSSWFGLDFNSSFWSNFTRHTGFLTYLFSAIFFYALVLVLKKDSIFLPLKAFVLGGVISAVSVYLSSSLFDVDWNFLKNSNGAGTLGNTTYAGIFLAFSLFSASVLFFNEERKNKKILWAVSSLFIFLSPIFINLKNILTLNITSLSSWMGDARVGLVSLVVGLLSALVLYFYWSEKRIYSQMAKGLLVLVFIAGAYFSVSLLVEGSKIHNSIVETRNGARFIYWDMAIQGIKDKPVFGWGLENFGAAHKKYFPAEFLSPKYPIEPWTDKPHNNFLEVAFSAGIIGLVIYLSLIGLVLISLIRKAQNGDNKERVTAALLFGLMVSYLLQLSSAFDTVISVFAFFVTLAVIFVFCFGPVDRKEERKNKKYLENIVIVALVVIAILIVYHFSYKVVKKSNMIRKIHTMTIEERLASFEKVMDISPIGQVENESQYIDITTSGYKKNWNTYPEEVRVKVRRNIEFLLGYSVKKSDQYPWDFRWALLASKVSSLLFDVSISPNPKLLEDAKKYAMRAISISPQNHMGYLTMVEIFLLENKPERAMKFVDMSIGLNPSVPEFHSLAVYVAKLMKNLKLAEEKIREAKVFIPEYEYKP